MTGPGRRGRLLALPLVVLVTAACASSSRLGEYRFTGRTLTMVLDAPARPEVFESAGPVDIDTSAELGDIFARVGATVLRDVSAAEAQRRLTAAGRRIDVGGSIAERTLERAARLLRMEPVPEQAAEFELELRIDSYGITSDDWNAQAFFFVEGELLLLDAADASIIWETDLRQYDPVNRGDANLGDSATDIVTAAIFATLTEDQMVAALDAVAEHTADHAIDRLQSGWDEARRR